MRELSTQLFMAWRRGGAWDEARPEPEMLRLPNEQRDSSASGVVRELVLSALKELGENRWIPWPSLERYLASDPRIEGIGRLLRRWAERVGAPDPDPMLVARRVVLESLPALGVIDLGEDDAEEGDEDRNPRIALRLTPRGRALLSEKPNAASASEETSKFLDTQVLRLGQEAKVAAILSLYGFVDLGRVAEALDLIVAPQTLARALSAGYEADSLRARIEAIAALPEGLSRTLQQASVVVGRGTFTAAAGFVWIEDANVRELLRTRRATSELFVDPSPPGGLLVAANVDMDRLARRCRSIGVELVAEGQVVRAKQGAPPATSGERRRTSSARMPKVKIS